MKSFFKLVILIYFPLITFSQSINVNNTFITDVTSKTKLGINAPYLFHHLLDDNNEVIESFRDRLDETNFDLIRFPGGALRNYYRFNHQGYGLIKSEVESVANTFNCYGDYWCLPKDENAIRNHIYDLVDLATHKFLTTGKKTNISFVLSVLLHWVYNFNQIQHLENINNLSDLEDAVSNGVISEDFRIRIMENYNAFQLLTSNPYINVVGLEFGNELYFYKEITNLDLSTNSNPFFDFQSTYNTLQPTITKLVTMIDFYRRILSDIDSNVKIGIPIANISHIGTSTNIGKVWNTLMKDMVLDHIDALIPHLYIKISAPNSNPNNIAGNDDNNQLIQIRDALELYTRERYSKILLQYATFFNLDNNDLKLWLTEWNTGVAGGNSTMWDEWSNSLLHGIFLNKMFEKLTTASSASTYVSYSFLHSWTGLENGFNHNMISLMEDERLLNRVSYWSNKIGSFLKKDSVIKLKTEINSTQSPTDFYIDFFYSSSNDSAEKLHVTFSNLKSEIVDVNIDNEQIIIDTVIYKIVDSKILAYQGLNLASSCGQTNFNSNNDQYEITVIEDSFILDTFPLTVQGYTTGTFEFTLEEIGVILVSDTTFVDQYIISDTILNADSISLFSSYMNIDTIIQSDTSNNLSTNIKTDSIINVNSITIIDSITMVNTTTITDTGFITNTTHFLDTIIYNYTYFITDTVTTTSTTITTHSTIIYDTTVVTDTFIASDTEILTHTFFYTDTMINSYLVVEIDTIVATTIASDSNLIIDTSIILFNPTTLNPINQFDIKVFPNPVNRYLKFEFNELGSFDGNLNIRLFNYIGQTIYSNTTNEKSLIIDLEDLYDLCIEITRIYCILEYAQEDNLTSQ